MKLQVHDFLGICLIGLILLIMGFTVYQIAIQWNIINGSKWPDGYMLILLMAVMLIISVFTFRRWRFFYCQLEQLTETLKNASAEEAVKLGEISGAGQLGRLWLAFRRLLEQETITNRELQQKYNKLLYSYMHLEEKYAQSYTVQLILEEIGRELDSDRLLKKTTDIVMGVFGSKRCMIYVKDVNNDLLVVKASSESAADLSVKDTLSLTADNIIAKAWRNLRIYTEADTGPEEMAELKKRNVNSILAIPLTGHRDCLGIMVIEHEREAGLSTDLIEFAKLISQELSLSVENAYLYGRMREMANHDALTGVFNRMYLINYIAELFAQKIQTVSLIMFDMDFFKRINDRYGHLTGDLVLKTTTTIIQKLLPAGILARYGGEEFVIVLPDVPQDEAALFGETICHTIAAYEFLTADGQQLIKITLSAGLANYPLAAKGYEELLQKADEALYEAKRRGRNRLCVAATVNG